MSNSISESTLYLFADSISDPEVVANPEATEKLFKLVRVLRRGLCSEADFCASVKRTVAGAYNPVTYSDLCPFPVRFSLTDGSNFKTTVWAYSNGGAENKVLDVLGDRCVRCLAFQVDGRDADTSERLYPEAQEIDCMMIGSISPIEVDDDSFDD